MQPKEVVDEDAPRRRRLRSRKYKIEKFEDLYKSTNQNLGEGSCGTVKTFYSREKGKEFAVKVVKKTNNLMRLKVLKEIEILHHCRGHKNIVQMQEFYEEEKQFYLVFEKMEGGSLLNHMEKRGRMREGVASKVIKDIANALFFLHEKNVAHRDVKLENILCSSEEDIFPVKLCDFDLSSEPYGSSVHSSGDMKMFSSAVGSVDYMAPEVVEVWLCESDYYTKQCDMWSLGVVLFILLSGSKPFVPAVGEICYCRGGDDECEYCSDERFETIKRGKPLMSPQWDLISNEAKDLVAKLLEKDPRRRLTPEQVLDHPWIADPPSLFTFSSPIPCSLPRKVQKMSQAGSEASSLLSNLCFSDVEDFDDMDLTEGVFMLELNDYQPEDEPRSSKLTSRKESSHQPVLCEKKSMWAVGSCDSGNVSCLSFLGSPCSPVVKFNE